LRRRVRQPGAYVNTPIYKAAPAGAPNTGRALADLGRVGVDDAGRTVEVLVALTARLR